MLPKFSITNIAIVIFICAILGGLGYMIWYFVAGPGKAGGGPASNGSSSDSPDASSGPAGPSSDSPDASSDSPGATIGGTGNDPSSQQPVNCVKSWGDYGACTMLTNTKTRTEIESVSSKNGGTPCGTFQTESVSCNNVINAEFGAPMGTLHKNIYPMNGLSKTGYEAGVQTILMSSNDLIYSTYKLFCLLITDKSLVIYNTSDNTKKYETAILQPPSAGAVLRLVVRRYKTGLFTVTEKTYATVELRFDGATSASLTLGTIQLYASNDLYIRLGSGVLFIITPYKNSITQGPSLNLTPA